MSDNKKAEFKKDLTSSSGGVMSKIWGTLEHAVNNIIGIIALVLIGFGIWYSFDFLSEVSSSGDDLSKLVMTPSKLWSLIVPVITTILGYLIGRKSS